MTREFVSGLPFAGEPAVAEPRGLQLLGRIRARAAAEAAELAPLTRSRFDGVERVDADPAAIRAKQDYDAMVALCDGVSSDTVLAIRIAALLARKVPE
jgi:hypothetical protein